MIHLEILWASENYYSENPGLVGNTAYMRNRTGELSFDDVRHRFIEIFTRSKDIKTPNINNFTVKVEGGGYQSSRRTKQMHNAALWRKCWRYRRWTEKGPLTTKLKCSLSRALIVPSFHTKRLYSSWSTKKSPGHLAKTWSKRDSTLNESLVVLQKVDLEFLLANLTTCKCRGYVS